MTNKERFETFMKLLNEATRLTGMKIEGCGCCESPIVVPVNGATSSDEDKVGAEYIKWDEEKQKYTDIDERDAKRAETRGCCGA